MTVVQAAPGDRLRHQPAPGARPHSHPLLPYPMFNMCGCMGAASPPIGVVRACLRWEVKGSLSPPLCWFVPYMSPRTGGLRRGQAAPTHLHAVSCAPLYVLFCLLVRPPPLPMHPPSPACPRAPPQVPTLGCGPSMLAGTPVLDEDRRSSLNRLLCTYSAQLGVAHCIQLHVLSLWLLTELEEVQVRVDVFPVRCVADDVGGPCYEVAREVLCGLDPHHPHPARANRRTRVRPH